MVNWAKHLSHYLDTPRFIVILTKINIKNFHAIKWTLIQSKILYHIILYHHSIQELYQQPLVNKIKHDKKLFLITCHRYQLHDFKPALTFSKSRWGSSARLVQTRQSIVFSAGTGSAGRTEDDMRRGECERGRANQWGVLNLGNPFHVWY